MQKQKHKFKKIAVVIKVIYRKKKSSETKQCATDYSILFYQNFKSTSFIVLYRELPSKGIKFTNLAFF